MYCFGPIKSLKIWEGRLAGPLRIFSPSGMGMRKWRNLLGLTALVIVWATCNGSHMVSNGSKVRVIVLPHSHEDPGWTQTIDEYYHGGYEYRHYGVKAIYDSVTAELCMHVDLKRCVLLCVYACRFKKR